ncbi:hypothetical protein PRIPAC_82043 [Pristionchus pacificus]|uniref:Nuclear receptor n=1 Tax=Pristionchus pacificus TaxID=54126 RepID=A0A2A6CNX0_PRIPA|nr:hypothetical protein PRIPAC_82043 [Pristionchus pacificus]|eukprot:PDM79894.1 nuclear receptor [Pristionchus pacificus]
MEESPPPVDSRRRCLVCGAPTTSCHYGVDACRACTVFYRKARNKKPYACRASTRRCGITADGAFACKRCRFDRYERTLRQSKDRYVIQDLPTSLPVPQLPVTEPVTSADKSTPRPLLDKCAICYKMMCAMRRNGELNARVNPPHPTKIAAGEYEIPPSTYGIMNSSSRFLLSGTLDIAEALFPEFSTFTREEQWKLAVSYYNRIFLLDGCYHAEKVFPDDMSKALGAYTAYMSIDIVEHFFDDCPNQSADLDEARSKFIKMALPSSRIAVKRANLDECEFHAVFILTFWFADCLQMRDEVVQAADNYRQQVMSELQSYYREDLKLEDYAARIGELFMLIFFFDRTADVDENFEIYRLLGVFTDDTFVYRLNDQV